MTEQYRVGDQVALIHDVAFRKTLKAGLEGEVVVAGLSFGWLSVVFAGHSRPHLVRPAHLRLVARAPAEVAP